MGSRSPSRQTSELAGCPLRRRLGHCPLISPRQKLRPNLLQEFGDLLGKVYWLLSFCVESVSYRQRHEGVDTHGRFVVSGLTLSAWQVIAFHTLIALPESLTHPWPSVTPTPPCGLSSNVISSGKLCASPSCPLSWFVIHFFGCFVLNVAHLPP